jgi:catechol 2,3-dioxygenase-like lactoylglutathione lyase family enzyme
LHAFDAERNTSLLRLGHERIELLEFTEAAGRPYPLDSTSTDLWFQHVAIVMNDMKHAYQRVMANGRFRPISRNGPVRLPDNSGDVTAFKFRDHDGHPLELLAFPEGHFPGQWRTDNGTGSFLGVDHTAIAISDSVSSARFFGSVFGFSTGTRIENRGPKQADLDNVEDVHVSVTRLAPDLPAPLRDEHPVQPAAPGYTIPPQADAGWIGEVGPGPSYLDPSARNGTPDAGSTSRTPNTADGRCLPGNIRNDLQVHAMLLVLAGCRFRSFPGKDHFGIAGPVPENALGRSRPQQPPHLGGECFDTVTE